MNKKRVMSNSNVIKYTSPRQLPFPPRYICKMVCTITGQINSAALPVSPPLFYTSYINSLANPFDTGQLFPGSGLSVTSTAPVGLGSIFSTRCYQRYRVFAAKTSMRLQPGNLMDQIQAVIIPLTPDTIFSSDTYFTVMAQPYAKTTSWTASNNRHWLTNKISVSKLMGVSSQAIKDDMSGNFYGTIINPPAQQCYWRYYINDQVGMAFSAPIGYQVKNEYWVEFWDLAAGHLYEM